MKNIISVLLSVALLQNGCILRAAESGWWDKTKEFSVELWSITKEKAPEYWGKSKEITKEAYNAGKEVYGDRKEIYAASKSFLIEHFNKSPEYWKALVEFCDRNKEEIVVGVVVVGGIILYALSSGKGGSPNYASIKDSTFIGQGREFTQLQKERILIENVNKNGGALKSDLSGIKLVLPEQHTKGYVPPFNEAHVDHIFPRSQGGNNSYSNAQVLSRLENLEKSDAVK